MGESNLILEQTVGVEVVRAVTNNSKDEYLKTPVLCSCGKQRRWLIRCEYCGTFEKISLEKEQ